jgi:hypothetical protein
MIYHQFKKYILIIDIYMKYFFTIISISYLFLSCSTESQSISDIQKLNTANSDKKFAFIQIPNEKEDSYNSKNSFGDIFVYNLIDSTLVRYTNDDFYDVGLSWSPDGKNLFLLLQEILMIRELWIMAKLFIIYFYTLWILNQEKLKGSEIELCRILQV